RDENDNAKDILINEAFLGFVETVDTSARELQKKILDSIESNGFHLSKCRGQGYDGAANMNGVYSVVQARIMEMEPLAKYVKRTAQNLAERWGAQSEFTEIRKRRMKRHFDELSQDERLSDGESRFRINVINASLDIINSQLSQRFTSMRETNELFQAIHPGTLNRAQDNALHQHSQRLADHYSRDLSPSFPVQLLAFRACFKTEIAKEPSVKDMTKMLIVDHSSMAATFSEVCTALLLYLTIPVTVATAERSFSKLKLIKTSSMGQERLSGLATLSIENSRARKLDLSGVVDDFAERKACKINF
ncbi:hypothetical protein JOQ06_016761, partial [Pogonophryne albipinna]